MLEIYDDIESIYDLESLKTQGDTSIPRSKRIESMNRLKFLDCSSPNRQEHESDQKLISNNEIDPQYVWINIPTDDLNSKFSLI